MTIIQSKEILISELPEYKIGLRYQSKYKITDKCSQIYLEREIYRQFPQFLFRNGASERNSADNYLRSSCSGRRTMVPLPDDSETEKFIFDLTYSSLSHEWHEMSTSALLADFLFASLHVILMTTVYFVSFYLIQAFF